MKIKVYWTVCMEKELNSIVQEIEKFQGRNNEVELIIERSMTIPVLGGIPADRNEVKQKQKHFLS